MTLFAATLLAGNVLAQGVSSAAERLSNQPADATQVAKRVESVRTLIESSSGARQVEASGDEQAKHKRAEARELHKKAEAAHKAGDLEGANKLLSAASAKMFEAVRGSAPEQVTADKVRNDFNARLDSVKALLAAQKRIGGEKADPKAAETTRSIEKGVAEAEKLAAANKLPEARATLDRAYLVAKASIGSMRGGDTLVRALKFDTKAEEYHYELDRNDTHQMLIKVLLDEKKGESDAMVQGFVQKANALRKEAEAAAGKGDHVKGIKLLEDSTAELVKAIRGAGIYIPG
jgi:hypothetical protein